MICYQNTVTHICLHSFLGSIFGGPKRFVMHNTFCHAHFAEQNNFTQRKIFTQREVFTTEVFTHTVFVTTKVFTHSVFVTTKVFTSTVLPRPKFLGTGFGGRSALCPCEGMELAISATILTNYLGLRLPGGLHLIHGCGILARILRISAFI